MISYRAIAQNTLAQFAAKVGSALLALWVMKLVTGFGPSFYGDYVTAYEFLAFFGVLADAGLYALVVRDMARRPAKTAAYLGNLLSLRLLLILGFTALAGFLAQLIPTYPERVQIGIWLTGLSMALTIVAGTLSSVLQARLRIYLFSASLLFSKALLALLVTFLAWRYHFSAEIFFWFLGAGVLSNVALLGITWVVVRREVPIAVRWEPAYIQELLTKALPYGLALVLQTLYLRVDTILISLLLGSAAVGIYGVSGRLMENLLVLGVLFSQTLLPKLAQESEKNNDKSLAWSIEKVWLFGTPIVLGGWFLAGPLITFISSAEFLGQGKSIGSNQLLLVLLPTLLLAYMNQLFSVRLLNQSRQKFLLAVNALALGLNAGLNLWLLPIYGLMAAAWTTLGSEVIVLLCLGASLGTGWIKHLSAQSWVVWGVANTGLITLLCLAPQNLWLVPISGGLYLGGLYVSKKLWWRLQ